MVTVTIGLTSSFFRAQGFGNRLLQFRRQQTNPREFGARASADDIATGVYPHGARQFRRIIDRDRQQVVGANGLRRQVWVRRTGKFSGRLSPYPPAAQPTQPP